MVKCISFLSNFYFLKPLVQNFLAYIFCYRSYKELLAKCNQLGRGEARSSEKLEKALEKIDKLKVCLSVLALSSYFVSSIQILLSFILLAEASEGI